MYSLQINARISNQRSIRAARNVECGILDVFVSTRLNYLIYATTKSLNSLIDILRPSENRKIMCIPQSIIFHSYDLEARL